MTRKKGTTDTPAQANTTTAWARLWAARGLPIFPCKAGTKQPATPHGFYDATRDLARVDAWAALGFTEWSGAGGHGVLQIDVDTDPAKRAEAGKAEATWGDVSREEATSGWPMGVDPATGAGHYAFATPPEWREPPPFLLDEQGGLKDGKPKYDMEGVPVTTGTNLAGSNCVDWRHWGGYVKLKGPPPADGGELPPLPPRLRRQLERAKGLNARVKKHVSAAKRIRTLEDALAHLEQTHPDGRHPALGRAVMPLVRFSLAGESYDRAHPTVQAVTAAYDRIIAGDRDAAAEVERDFISAFETVGGDFRQPGQKSRRKKDFAEVAAESGDNLKERLEKKGIRLRFNLRGLVDQIRFGNEPWEQVTDRNEAHCRVLLGAMDWEDRVWRVLWLNTLYLTTVDPVHEWLLALPPWDRTPRVDGWAARAFTIRSGEENTRMARWASIHVFLGSVQRTLSPGTHADTSPVLMGPQEVGKSKQLEAIFPPELRDAFGDELNLGSQAKAMLEAIQGKMIVEIAEMSGLTRAKLDTLKAFLTRNVDNGIRLAYRRNPESAPRRCIFVGTVNDDGTGVLPDDGTGNRRWAILPINAQGEHWSTLMAEREQYWAEALHRVRAGEDPSFPADLRAIRAETNEMHRQADALEEVVADAAQAIRARCKREDVPGLPLTELFGPLGLRGAYSEPTEAKDGKPAKPGDYRKTIGEITKGESMRLARALKAQHWGRRRHRYAGIPQWLWVPPEE